MLRGFWILVKKRPLQTGAQRMQEENAFLHFLLPRSWRGIRGMHILTLHWPIIMQEVFRVHPFGQNRRLLREEILTHLYSEKYILFFLWWVYSEHIEFKLTIWKWNPFFFKLKWHLTISILISLPLRNIKTSLQIHGSKSFCKGLD